MKPPMPGSKDKPAGKGVSKKGSGHDR